MFQQKFPAEEQDKKSLNFIGKAKEIMLIERTSREVIVRVPAFGGHDRLQRLVDYLTYKEATANSKATQEQVDQLARDVKKGWGKTTGNAFL